ncbi:protein-disulfide reductase DsbD domain-containing protein [uncultured Thioclava sp.]|uniref:protein-disulfide reductase DsbD domain-containing protein n=1 Tax=uncultured Thioclava sp. TaxID=473858 RepID=UPI0025F27005|nr:protein-disulfide reductase DsbD domain-containing protein [uncultured Thioclava sp.]
MTRILPVLALTLAAHAPMASAQQSQEHPAPPPPPGLEGAQLLSGWMRVDGTRVAGLSIALEPGWKTYWRAPGDAGIPPQIDFQDSENVANIALHWPTPEVFDSAGMRTIGYHGDLLLPITITPKDASKPVDLDAHATIGICDQICVPVSLNLRAHLDGKGQHDPQIEAALDAEPKTISAQAHCETKPVRDGVNLTARLELPPAIGPEDTLFELRSTPVWVSESSSHREGNMLIASADFVPPEAKPFDLDLSDLRITVLSDRGAVQIDGCTE